MIKKKSNALESQKELIDIGMNIEITRKNRVICEECWNADSGNTFLASTKIDDRLSKDNLKLYNVKWVKGDGKFSKIHLQPDDVVMTEAVGVDIELEGKTYKIFDTDFIVAKVDLKEGDKYNDRKQD